MKKLFPLLTVAMFAVSTSIVNAQTVQTHTKTATTAQTSRTTVRTKTDATPDVQVSIKTHTNRAPQRRYNKRRTTRVSSATHVKADGSAGVIQKKTTTTTKSN